MRLPNLKLFLVLFVLNAPAAFAQYKSGGCVVPGKQIKLNTITLYAVKTTVQKDTQLEHFYKWQRDSVVVSKNGKTISTLKIEDHFYISGSYREYDTTGTLRLLDSVDRFRMGAKNYHFGPYAILNVHLRKTFYSGGAPESILYYNFRGHDSLELQWSESGLLRSLKRFENDTSFIDPYRAAASPQPIEVLEYHTNGVLATRSLPERNYKAEYNNTGIIERISYDTLIAGKELNCVRTYWTSSILKTISHYQNALPCCTWLEYNKNGTLARTIKHPAPRNIHTVLAEPAAEEIFSFVEERAYYPGDIIALRSYLEKNLGQMHFKNLPEPSGSYKLRFEVPPGGKVRFISLEGYEAKLLQSELKHLVESMSSWKPGKRNGRPVSEFYELTLSSL